MSHDKPFLEELALGGFLLDGGMGTELLAKRTMEPHEVAGAVLTCPREVERIHRSFLEAGSRWLLTHTFGANALALRGGQWAGSVERLNTAAVDLARTAAQGFSATWIAGSIGPASLWCGEDSRPTEPELSGVYAQQAEALMAAGVDLFSLETFGGSAEALTALNQVQSHGLPVVVSMTFVERGREFQTLDGEPLLRALEKLERAGAGALGVNCATGSEQTLECLRTLVGRFAVPLCAKPNAGMPVVLEEGLCYEQAPEEFAEHMLLAAQLGVAGLGGCCGVDARFIACLARALSRK